MDILIMLSCLAILIIIMYLSIFLTKNKNDLSSGLPSQSYAVRDKGNGWITFMMKIDFIEHEFLYNKLSGHITTIRVDKK